MEIAYPCNMCDSKICRVLDSGPHKKLVCVECGGHVKFISKKDLEEYRNTEWAGSTAACWPTDGMSWSETNEVTKIDLLKEINFRLDLIMDHLNIKEGE